MKFLIIGLGSMGKRRIRNLKYLNENEIIGFDTRDDRCKEIEDMFGIKTFKDLEKAIQENPDVMIISTPPDLHMRYAKIAIEQDMHFFTEASVTEYEMSEVIQMLKRYNKVGLPSCTWRYHPVTLQVQNLINSKKIGNPLVFFHHCGQYLPDWHPWEDYRKYYVSKKETSATKEMISFELVWLVHLFGYPVSVTAIKSKVSDLEIEIDDVFMVLLEFQNGVRGNLLVDVISRFPYRQIKILGQEGVIIADWLEKETKYFTKQSSWIKEKVMDQPNQEGYIHSDQPYIEEMKSLIKLINNQIDYPYTFEEDKKVLRILHAVEKSSDSGTRQIIE